jgi:glycosyltransferase involved in cell wall biosynthesis
MECDSINLNRMRMDTNETRITALLGRRDEPTDAVEEYCRYLGGALRAHGFEPEVVRVSWAERGWSSALRELAQQAVDWRGRWVCVQYTALAWSARGFPLQFVRILNLLRRAGTRVAVVYHDPGPFPGTRYVDQFRRAVQRYVMRQSLRCSELAIFTVPLNNVSWLGLPSSKAVFIPVGANLPINTFNEEKTYKAPPDVLRVAVFGITGGDRGREESARIADVLRFVSARIGKLELHAFGRQADAFESILCESLRDAQVDVLVKGVLPPEEVVRELNSADALLFVRGAISTRRGSAIAGIACGLPVIAQRGAETSGPVEEAGVVMVSGDKPAEFGEALLQVLIDPVYRAQLAESSRRAHRKYFSWQRIAEHYVEELQRRA